MAFNPYAAGNKHYGGGRSAPNIGPVGPNGALGYRERDLQVQARRNALLRRLRSSQTGNYQSGNYLGYLSAGQIS